MRKTKKITKPARVTKTKSTQTSWGHVANWYHEHVSDTDTYHEQVVKPNLIRALGDIHGKRLLDLACGEGYFTRIVRDLGAEVTGADIAPELIQIAKQKGPSDILYISAPAERIPLPDSSFDIVMCVLALQNIQNISGAIAQVAHVLERRGTFMFVLNHPAFRMPKKSAWGYDPDQHVQFRRVDGYLSEYATDIQMHPGSKPGVVTVSHHRPLQLYVKELIKHGFVITGMEEWISHRTSEEGPRKVAEDRSRKEFPLFLMIKARRE